MLNRTEFGRFLAQKRKAMHITQETAADIIGVAVRTVRNIENGATSPDADTLFSLCDLYGITGDSMFSYYTRSPEMAYAMAMVHICVDKNNKPIVFEAGDVAIPAEQESEMEESV